MDKHIDILIPTIGRPCLKTAISGIVKQTYKDWRLNILADGHGQEVREILRGFADQRIRLIDVPNGPLGRWGHPATRWAFENLDIHGWIYFQGDDDCLYPEALDSYASAMEEGCGMIIGVAKGMKKSNPTQFAKWLGAGDIKVCEVTGACGLYNLDRVKQLEKPIFVDQTYDSDWKLIERLMQKFPYKRISTVVTLFPMTGF